MGGLEALTFICLDTSFLIDFLRGEDAARESYLHLRSEGYNFASTVVNIFELYRGVDKRGRIKRDIDAVGRLASRLVIWNLTLASAERCSRIYTEMERSGKVIGLNDCFTAAIAMSNGCQTIVSDDSHFERITGVERIPY